MLFELLLLVLSIPAGFLIAWMARDELIQGRKWFLALMGLFLLSAMILFMRGLRVEGYSSLFIVVVSALSYWKSFDKKWTTRKLK